jgi:hypothetical protein
MPLERRADPLRFIAVRLALPELEIVARQPGVIEAFRVTVMYHEGQHPDQIATLAKRQGSLNPALAVHYRRANDKSFVLNFTIDSARFGVIHAELRKLGFDKLDDPPDIPWHGADLWLVGRASGTFHHDVIIAPETATGVYAEIVRLVRENLHEAVRPINP